MDQLKEQLKAVYEIMRDPELVEAMAEMSWNLYNKFLEKGFSDEQAIKLVTRFVTSGK